jgi:transposase
MRKFREYLPDQPFLFPPSLTDWLPKDHPVHFIDEVVECLDLRTIYNEYGRKGQPPYNPSMMVKVFMYDSGAETLI